MYFCDSIKHYDDRLEGRGERGEGERKVEEGVRNTETLLAMYCRLVVLHRGVELSANWLIRFFKHSVKYLSLIHI